MLKAVEEPERNHEETGELDTSEEVHAEEAAKPREPVELFNAGHPGTAQIGNGDSLDVVEFGNVGVENGLFG